MHLSVDDGHKVHLNIAYYNLLQRLVEVMFIPVLHVSLSVCQQNYSPLPQTDIIRVMMIVCRVRRKIIRSVKSYRWIS